MAKITKAQADHIVGRISGVNEGDTKVEAIQKVIDTMRGAGHPPGAIARAEAILAALKAKEANNGL